MSTKDKELLRLLEEVNKIKKQKKKSSMNLEKTSKTRQLYGSSKKKIVNKVPEAKMGGLYYQNDIQSNQVPPVQNQPVQDDPIGANDLTENLNNPTREYTKNTMGVPSIRDSTNFATQLIRDDYYRNRPGPMFDPMGSEDVLFRDQRMAKDQVKRLCTNTDLDKNNPQNSNKVDYQENTQSRQYSFLQNEYVNKPLLYQNINEVPLTEYIKEHTLIIDSADRDATAYPDSLSFKVKFKGMGSNTYTRKFYDHTSNQFKTDTYNVQGTTKPYFFGDLEKVRYLKLDKLMLPDCYQLGSGNLTDSGIDVSGDYPGGITTPTDTGGLSSQVIGPYTMTYVYSTSEYSFYHTATGKQYYYDSINYYYHDESYKVSHDRFAQIEIEEISGTNNYATNDTTSKTFGILYLDKKYYDNGFVYVSTNHSNILYKFSDLKNFHSLTFKFYDSFGKLMVTDPNNLITSDTNTHADISEPISTEYHPHHYILHPLFKFRQIHMIFKVGVLKVEQNLKNFA